MDADELADAARGCGARIGRGLDGRDVATQYAAAQLDAVAGFRRLIAEQSIDCALTDAPAVTYATEEAAGEAVAAKRTSPVPHRPSAQSARPECRSRASLVPPP